MNTHLSLSGPFGTVLIVALTLCAIVLAAAVVVTVGQLVMHRRKRRMWTREDRRVLRGEREMVP